MSRSWPTGLDVLRPPGSAPSVHVVQTGRLVAQDFAALSNSPELRTAADWQTLPEEIRLGLPWDQFTAARGKYGTVVAAAVTEDRPVGSVIIGCIALDGPPDMEDELSATSVVNRALEAGKGLLQRR
jgi:hypothetical protein